MLKEPVVLLSLVCVALAAVGLAPIKEKPKKFEGIEGCYIKQLDAVVPFGESVPSKTGCMKYRCSNTSVEIVFCESVSAEPPCYVMEDLTKPYPDCCRTVRCDNRR